MRLWRIVRDPNGSREDFLSAQAMGREPRSEMEARLFDGLSMFESADLAIRKANAIVRTRGGRKIRVLGDYVVPIDIEPDMRIPHERTTQSEGHHTVWISPERALSLALWREVMPAGPGVPNPANSMERRVTEFRERQEGRRTLAPGPREPEADREGRAPPGP